MITIELIGSYIATHSASCITADLTKDRNRGTTKSPIPVLCRKLLASGYDPDQRVHVVRKALTGNHLIPVFKRDRKLLIWSAVDIIEDVAKGPRQTKHRPYAGPVAAQEAQGEAGEHRSTGETARLLNAANGNRKNASLIAGEVR